MSDYTVTTRDEAPDVLGDYPGELRMYTGPLGCEQVAFSWRVMPQGTGGKGSYGHSHKTQEEIYFVISGRLEFKLGDELVELGPNTVVRLAPSTVRSVWNERPEEAELVMCSIRVEGADHETHEDFWPEDTPSASALPEEPLSSGEYTILNLGHVPDPSGDAPGEIRFCTGSLDTEQMAFTYRRIPPGTGGIAGKRIGHSHKTQEEVYFVIAGTLRFKLDGEEFDVGPKTAVRIGPGTTRAVWNAGEGDVEMLMCSVKVEDLRAEVEMDPDFWPGPD